MAHTPAIKEEAIRLRVEERLGLGAIAAELGVSKGSASLWLQEYPLPEEVLLQKQSARGLASRGRRKVCKPTVPEVSTRFRDTAQDGHGLPYVSLRCADGTKNGSKPMKARRYREDEFDFIVGYDLRTDVCFVWSHAETVSHRASITISEEAAERWDKLRAVAQQ